MQAKRTAAHTVWCVGGGLWGVPAAGSVASEGPCPGSDKKPRGLMVRGGAGERPYAVQKAGDSTNHSCPITHFLSGPMLMPIMPVRA